MDDVSYVLRVVWYTTTVVSSLGYVFIVRLAADTRRSLVTCDFLLLVDGRSYTQEMVVQF